MKKPKKIDWRLTMKLYHLVAVGLFLLLSACASKQSPEKENLIPPPERDLPNTPNCAADGPDCKQFNPDLK